MQELTEMKNFKLLLLIVVLKFLLLSLRFLTWRSRRPQQNVVTLKME